MSNANVKEENASPTKQENVNENNQNQGPQQNSGGGGGGHGVGQFGGGNRGPPGRFHNRNRMLNQQMNVSWKRFLFGIFCGCNDLTEFFGFMRYNYVENSTVVNNKMVVA